MLYIILICMSLFLSFFSNDLLLTVYFIFILDYENDVRQKAIRVIFLFEFKIVHKAAETTQNINSTFSHRTAN